MEAVATPLFLSDDALDDLAASTGGHWTPAALMALVAGRRLLMGRPVAERPGYRDIAPDWLAAAAIDVRRLPAGVGDEIIHIHPLDRGLVATSWNEASQHPGRLVRCTYRARRENGLRWLEDISVDLAGELGLETITGQRDLGPAPGLEEWDEVESSFELASTPVTLVYWDANGLTVSAEGRVEEIFGRSSDEIVGHLGLEFIDPRYHDLVATIFINVLSEPSRTQSIRFEIVRPDDSRVWVETTVMNRLADPRIGAVVGITHDITEQLAAERARREHDEALRQSHDELRRSHAEFETLANNVPAAVVRVDGIGVITYANDQWRRLVGEDHTERLADIVACEDREALAQMLLALATPGGPRDMSMEIRGRDGARVFSLSCQAVGGSGSGPRPVIGSMADVTSTTELRHLAQHDDLTGLLNRHGIESRLREALVEDATNVLVAFIDLDGFKTVNDECGHEAGDEVLRVVASRLRKAVRPTDEVSRYGGDEFVVVCRGANDGAEHAVAARIEEVLAPPIELATTTWIPRASIGMARAQPDEALASVLRRADQAMYRTKREHHSAAGLGR